MSKIIYDFGANNGDDIPYYLIKADLVVAVEANPSLCQLMKDRFQDEIQSGKLIIENCVLTASDELSEVTFYIHKRNHVLSQFPEPADEEKENFEKVKLPSKSVINIIKQYGLPHYIKIDIEHYDSQILRALFEEEIHPPFISAESHSVEVFTLLVSLGKYNSFKLIDGATVSSIYSKRHILGQEGEIVYSFPHHSAGPFGNDIDGRWMDAKNFFRLLALEGFGWKDIHATNIVEADSTAVVPSANNCCSYFLTNKLKKIMTSLSRRIKRRLPFLFDSN